MLSEADAKRVEGAIREAEQLTSGEIVAVLADQSGGYQVFAVLWASLAALLAPWPLIELTWWPVEAIYAVQIILFAALALLFSLPGVRPRIVPGAIKSRWAHRRAVDQFLVQSMHTTRGRTGVMIFVSVAERYAEVLADTGIYERVPKARWQAIVDQLIARIAEGRPGDGFVEAIKAAGGHLAEHFPKAEPDNDELPNHLIVLRSR
ncbi:MAG: hypothetical protein F9K44_13995 [Hyphomicrobiaceae bacterium]|nr:MAG: hypothetical protein F9K44_13995 [Hyphomicrobiaceae bacterium]